MERLFGTDGVRGVANTELTPELAFKLGRAAAYYFGKEHPNPMFLIGRDTRLSGQMLEAALASGICSAGGKAILAGVIPTPAVAFLTKQHHAQAGIVISASHNPFIDNGIKFFAATGYKLPDETEDILSDLVLAQEDSIPRYTGEKVGIIEYRHDLLQEYIEFVIRLPKVDFKGLKIVLDCANGAAYEAAPLVLERLGAEVIVLNNNPNGININNKCGSTHLEALQQAVVKYGADLGIAHDGDADRCLAVDNNGQIVDGDHIMVICALAMMKEGKLHDNTLVVTVMSNIGLHQAIKDNGGKLKITPVGDRYVLESMLKYGHNLGGEQSGHIIFKDYATTGDGLVTAVKLIEAVKLSNKKLSELQTVMTSYPQVLVNVRVKSKSGWEEQPDIKAAIKQADAKLGDSGRILVRASGTEPLIRVMAEGSDMDELKKIVDEVAEVIKMVMG